MDILKFIQDFMNKLTVVCNRIFHFVSCIVWYIPKLWICTLIIKRRIKKETNVKIMDVPTVDRIIRAAVKPGLICRVEYTDHLYVEPKREWITYIADNMWTSYRKIRQFVYGENYDCDNFSVSFLNLIQELMLGLCIGIAHIGYVKNGKYTCHAINCFVLPLDSMPYLWLLEPQADVCDMWIANSKDIDLYFVYLEGRQTF